MYFICNYKDFQTSAPICGWMTNSATASPLFKLVCLIQLLIVAPYILLSQVRTT